MKSAQIGKYVIGGLLALASLAAPAHAAVISVVPPAQDANVGDTVTADILVALGLNEAVGGVSLLLSFDPSVLTGLDFVNDPDGAMGVALDPFNDFGSAFAAGGGSPLELFFLADVSLPTFADLKPLQGAGFRLATVSFTALAPGLSPLSLSVVPVAGRFLSDAAGNELAAQAIPGSVCVGGAAACVVQAPEPGTLSLLGLGAAALIAGRRRRARRLNV